MSIERGVRRIVLVVSVGVFLFGSWSVWNTVDRGLKQRALREARRAWEEGECPRILSGQPGSSGYAACREAKELEETLAAAGWLFRDSPPQLSEESVDTFLRTFRRPKGDAEFPLAPFPLWVWWPYLAFWEDQPYYTAVLGTALSAVIALVPWGIFYVIRWIIRGFS
ncbi:MAG: hypothetical protein HY002_06730 [Candidatus Rokubacteria bacterium]|nr:hypothetical protein [Candidatus Rokubacteria bacterium]